MLDTTDSEFSLEMTSCYVLRRNGRESNPVYSASLIVREFLHIPLVTLTPRYSTHGIHPSDSEADTNPKSMSQEALITRPSAQQVSQKLYPKFGSSMDDIPPALLMRVMGWRQSAHASSNLPFDYNPGTTQMKKRESTWLVTCLKARTLNKQT